MHTASALTSAPRPASPDRPAIPHRGRASSFKPLLSTAATPAKTHLSNLERVLRKTTSSPPPPPPPQPQLRSDALKEHEPVAGGGSLFRSLNIPSLLSFTRNATEENQEMSPRSLSRLRHRLSGSSGPSPRNSIGPRWREYHGAREWAGLLDPLDENLRRELVRYGDFVGAAYNAFHSDPTVPADSHRPVSLPDHSYRVTRGLHATSSVPIPRWVRAAAPAWATQRTSWIGYVAVCESDSEIRRMGRRDIVVALRGTATCLEWAENFRANLVPMDGGGSGSGSGGGGGEPAARVECGFWSLYTTRGARVPSLSEAVVAEVLRLAEEYEGEELSVTVTGHSLGAALAVLAADELASRVGSRTSVAAFSFGGPRVGNGGFARHVAARGAKVLRVVNAHDVVTRVPGGLLSRGTEGYADVGRELRVDSRASPFLRPDADPACCHDLEAYLHLVDGYLAGDRPFRSNAKRSLVRLLHHQGSNVKKLYVSKARELGAAWD